MLPDFSKNFANQPSPTVAGGDKNTKQQGEIASQGPPVKKLDIRYMLSVLLLTFSIISIGGIFGLNAYLDREIASIESSIGVLEETIKTNEILDLAIFEKQAQALKDITISRGGYSLLLAEASKLVVPGVHYSTISLASKSNDGHTLVIKGVANSLIQYHQQIQRIEANEGILANGNFDRYSLQHNEGGGTTVLFTVSFNISMTEIAETPNNTS